MPITDRLRLVHTRVPATDILRQEAITCDNVPVGIDGALFFKVSNNEDTLIRIQDYVHTISLLAQTVLRDVVGGMNGEKHHVPQTIRHYASWHKCLDTKWTLGNYRDKGYIRKLRFAVFNTSDTKEKLCDQSADR